MSCSQSQDMDEEEYDRCLHMQVIVQYTLVSFLFKETSRANLLMSVVEIGMDI